MKKEYCDRVEYYNDKGQLHRLDGPALEWSSGTRSWWINGKFHRVDGPAIERVDGHKSWFINGMKYTEQEWQEKTIKIKLNRLKNYVI